MGYGSRPANVLLFLSALEQILAEQGYKFDHGASIAAATASYSQAAKSRRESCDTPRLQWPMYRA